MLAMKVRGDNFGSLMLNSINGIAMRIDEANIPMIKKPIHPSMVGEACVKNIMYMKVQMKTDMVALLAELAAES